MDESYVLPDGAVKLYAPQKENSKHYVDTVTTPQVKVIGAGDIIDVAVTLTLPSDKTDSFLRYLQSCNVSFLWNDEEDESGIHKSIPEGFCECPLAFNTSALEITRWLQVDENTLFYQKQLPFTGSHSYRETCKLVVRLFKYVSNEVAHKGRKILAEVERSFRELHPPSIFYKPIPRDDEHRILLHVSNKSENVVSIWKNDVIHASGKAGDESFYLTLDYSCLSLPISLKPKEQFSFLLQVSVKQDSCLPVGQSARIEPKMVCHWTEKGQASQTKQRTVFTLPVLNLRSPSLLIRSELVSRANGDLTMRYVINNQLRDFHALRLLWAPERILSDPRAHNDTALRAGSMRALRGLICRTPEIDLGPCKEGTIIEQVVQFMLLKPGVYEMGQHMKLHLQYSVGSELPSGGAVFERKGSISSTRSMPTDTVARSAAQVAKSSSLHQGAALLELRTDSPMSVRRMTHKRSVSAGPPSRLTSQGPATPPASPLRHVTRPKGHSRTPSGASAKSSLSSQSAVSQNQVLKKHFQVLVTPEMIETL